MPVARWRGRDCGRSMTSVSSSKREKTRAWASPTPAGQYLANNSQGLHHRRTRPPCLQPLPSRLQRKNRLKHSNPLFHYGQVVKGPLRTILKYGTYSPIDFGRQHTALRRIKQKIPLGIGRKIPPQPPHDFEIAAQDPLPLVAWKVGEEIRDIVADRPD